MKSNRFALKQQPVSYVDLEETLMECIQPGAIRDEELIAYLAGERVRPAVAQHLAMCPSCATRLATYRRIELKLTSKLYRWDCPSNHILGEYQMGFLTSEQALEVKSHLSRCILCTSELVTLTEFLADPVLEPASVLPKQIAVQPSRNNHHPVQQIKRAVEQWREESLAGARRIIATLLPAQPRLAFQRDAASQTALWPRRYTAEDVSISLQVERGTDRKGLLQVIGFVTRKGTSLEALQGATVQLMGQGNIVSTQTIDDLGNFVFSSMKPGTYTLEMHLSEGIVVIEGLSLLSQD